MKQDKSKPFLIWVGGKRQLVDTLSEHVPHQINNYYEPFLGGGALFFSLRSKCKHAYLSDINLDLTTSYNAIKYSPDEVCKMVDQHEDNHSREYFCRIRDNNNSNNPGAISARFLYLNRYSFRGIYRININNKLKLCYSTRKYKNKISTQIKQANNALQNATIYTSDFSFIEPSKNDFVYLDPPYHNSGEGFYTRLPFDEAEQLRLKNFVDKLSIQGVKIMISNNGTDFIADLYKGYNIKIFDIKYAIDNSKRKNKEVIITNY